MSGQIHTYKLLFDVCPDDAQSQEPTGTLYALLPKDTCRYDRKTTDYVQQDSMAIVPGMFASGKEPEPPYWPPQWIEQVHPEGAVYYCKHEQNLCILTEMNIKIPGNISQLEAWLRKVSRLLKDSNIVITEHMELFILPWKEDCFYYFIDYATRTTFFLECEDSVDMGLGLVASQSHLKITLEGQFWQHVENFPMHRGGLPVQAVDDLINVFCHAQIDLSTSAQSTYCYTLEQLRDYMNILKISRENIHDGHHVCLVARLWHAMYIHRFLTHYGQDKARLNRNQAIIFPQHEGKACVDRLLSLLTLNANTYYLSKFNDAHTDRIAYTTTWQAFCTQSLKEWQDVIKMSFAGMMLHVFFLVLPAQSTLGVVSFSLLGASASTALLLTNRFRDGATKHAPFAHQYLENLESESVGFRWPAFVLAIPYALLIWGIGVSFANCLYLVQNSFGAYSALAALIFVFVAFFCFQYSTANAQPLRALVATFLKREKEPSDMV